MKQFFSKVKAFFNRVGGAIEQKTNNDWYTAFFTFMFYVSLMCAAIMFLSGVFKALSFIGAILMIAGCYFSVSIIHHFISDFVNLIRFYLENRKETEDNVGEEPHDKQ